MDLQTISNHIDVVKGYPKPNVNFRDISPLLMNPEVNAFTISKLYEIIKSYDYDAFAALDARGFLLINLAAMANKPFIMIRKGGKLPNSTSIKYGTEYSQDEICISNNFPSGKKIILLDDLFVTGGTFSAAIELVERVGSSVVACLTIASLVGCTVNPKMKNYPNLSLLKYHIDSTSKELDPILNIVTKRNVINFIPFEDESDKIVVFSHPSMESIAEGIISNNPYSYRRGGIKWDKFPDGTPNITFENRKYLENRNVIYIMNFLEGDLFEQISMMKVLPRQGILSLDVYIPYFHVGTMERVDEFGPNELATADTLSSMLASGISHTKTGPIKLHIYDLHTLQNRFYFGDNIHLEPEHGLDLLLGKLKKDDLIIFPDDGAAKRFGKFFKNFTTLTCSKRRDGNLRYVTVEGFENLPKKVKIEHAIIIDDLVQSGGTLDECRKALKLKGVSKVSAFVTHVIFPNNSHLKFIGQKDGFHKFYFTNSNPHAASKLNCEPFHMLKLENNIVENSCNIRPAKIYVASTSQLKLEAVWKSFNSTNPNIKVYGIDVGSDVSEQPVDEETMTGCENRMKNLKNYLETNSIEWDYLVSIENGIFMGTRSYDKAKIMISNKTSNLIETSQGVLIPDEYIIKFKETGSMIGTLLKQDYGYDSKSWHHNFEPFITRSQLITDTINKIISN